MRAMTVLCAGFLSLVLSGCTTTLGTILLYNHADWLITRQLDRYFHLSRSQKQFVTARLEVIHDQHRQEALPWYESIVGEMRDRIARGLTEEDVTWAFAQYDQARTDLLSRFVTDGADFVRLVEEPQIRRVRDGLASRLAKQEPLLQESRETRLGKHTLRVLALVNDWLGPISREQELAVTDVAMGFPDTLPIFHAHQHRRSDQLVAMMSAKTQSNLRERFRDWLLEPDYGGDRTFGDATADFRRHASRLILTLDRLATPTQREHVLAKLDDLAHAVHWLSKPNLMERN